MTNTVKTFKRIFAILMAFAFIVMCLPAGNLKAQAALKDEIPKKVRIYSLSINNSAIPISLPSTDYKITKLKSNSSNLKVYKTYDYTYNSSNVNNSTRTVNIGCYARKTGKYKVSFNVVDKNNNKVKSYKVLVFAKDDYPVKYVKYAGKRLDLGAQYDSVMPDSGAFQVKLAKGYKIKKIAMKTYVYSENRPSTDTVNGSSKKIEQEIQNGQTVNLSDIAYKYLYSYSGKYYSSYDKTENMCAETDFTVTYIDRWSKQERTFTYSVHKLVNFNK